MDKNDGYNYINDDEEKEYIIKLINETKLLKNITFLLHIDLLIIRLLYVVLIY